MSENKLGRLFRRFVQGIKYFASETKHTVLTVLFTAFVILLAFLPHTLRTYRTINKEIQDIEVRMSQVEHPINQSWRTNSEQTIAFFQEEMTRHREFIEDQRQDLLWIVVSIGSIAVIVLGLVGLSNRSEIKATMKEQFDEKYKEYVKDEFDKKVDQLIGTENRDHLINAVMKEKNMASKKMLFVSDLRL